MRVEADAFLLFCRVSILKRDDKKRAARRETAFEPDAKLA